MSLNVFMATVIIVWLALVAGVSLAWGLNQLNAPRDCERVVLGDVVHVGDRCLSPS